MTKSSHILMFLVASLVGSAVSSPYVSQLDFENSCLNDTAPSAATVENRVCFHYYDLSMGLSHANAEAECQKHHINLNHGDLFKADNHTLNNRLFLVFENAGFWSSWTAGQQTSDADEPFGNWVWHNGNVQASVPMDMDTTPWDRLEPGLDHIAGCAYLWHHYIREADCSEMKEVICEYDSTDELTCMFETADNKMYENGVCYTNYPGLEIDHASAEAACQLSQDVGTGEMYTANNATLNKILYDAFGQFWNGYWTGGRQPNSSMEPTGNWVWFDGISRPQVEFTDDQLWMPDKIVRNADSTYNEKDCLMLEQGPRLLVHKKCSTSKHRICEYYNAIASDCSAATGAGNYHHLNVCYVYHDSNTNHADAKADCQWNHATLGSGELIKADNNTLIHLLFQNMIITDDIWTSAEQLDTSNEPLDGFYWYDNITRGAIPLTEHEHWFRSAPRAARSQSCALLGNKKSEGSTNAYKQRDLTDIASCTHEKEFICEYHYSTECQGNPTTWSSWSSCSEECDFGVMNRTRPVHNRTDCTIYVETEYIACQSQPCRTYPPASIQDQHMSDCLSNNGFYTNNACYFVKITNPPQNINWSQAFSECDAVGARLAHMYDTEMLFERVMTYLLANYPGIKVWLGAKALKSLDAGFAYWWSDPLTSSVLVQLDSWMPSNANQSCLYVAALNYTQTHDNSSEQLHAMMDFSECDHQQNVAAALCMKDTPMADFNLISEKRLVPRSGANNDAVDVGPTSSDWTCGLECKRKRGCIGYNYKPNDNSCELTKRFSQVRQGTFEATTEHSGNCMTGLMTRYGTVTNVATDNNEDFTNLWVILRSDIVGCLQVCAPPPFLNLTCYIRHTFA